MTQPKTIPEALLDDPDIRRHYVQFVMERIDWPADAAGCWIWTGAHYHFDHGWFRVHGIDTPRNVMVHRVMYAWWYGDTAMVLDHLCRNPSCVNPMHLEPVTQYENNDRSPDSITAVNARKTQCVNGHPFDEANTYWSTRADGRKRRHCRACQAERNARHNVKRRERRRAAKEKYV